MNKKGAMKLDDLPNIAFIFLLAGVFFAIAIVILGTFQTQTYVDRSVTGDSFTTPMSNSTVNGSITLDHNNLVSFSSITNGTATLGSGNYSVNTLTGVVTFIRPNQNSTVNAVCYFNKTCYAAYTYTDDDQSSSTAVGNTIDAVAEIPNNWLVLIALVVAAAVIIGIVVSNLGGMGSGRS